jgi:hypothetical protein
LTLLSRSYGDPINPDADLEAMQSLLQYSHATTYFYIAVPVGHDAVFWNEGRVYGDHRLPRLLAGFTLVDSFGIDPHAVRTRATNLTTDFPHHQHTTQPVFVLSSPLRQEVVID